MARHLRVEFPGAIYHVTVRMLGDWKRETNLLFEDNADRQRYLLRLSERVEQYNIRLYLFVLMANHVHLVFETPEANCSRFMQSLTTAYTVYFNLRHGRHGHLVDGRFKAKLVEGDTYVLALSRYVHLNPVFVDALQAQPLDVRMRALRQYPWSSYPSYIGLSPALDFVTYGPMLGELGGAPGGRSRRYRAFVETGLAEDDEAFKQALEASPRSIGSDAFRAWVDRLYQQRVATHPHPEDVAFRRVTNPMAPEVVLDRLAGILNVPVGAFRQRRRDSALRGAAARFLCRYAGLTQREVAGILQVGSGAAISHQLRNLSAILNKDHNLARLLQRAEKQFEADRRTATEQTKSAGA